MQKHIVRRQPLAKSDALAHFHPVLQRIYAHRGVQSTDDIDHGLSRLCAPNLMGIDQAVQLLADALKAEQHILIIGDFDADGATSTAVAVKCLRALGHHAVDFLVPNRFEFGYGLTPEIVKVAAERQPDIIVTVDNGISSIEGVKEAKQLGIKVVITDHHLPGRELPAADAIVNPNQSDCPFLSKHAAGVGVIFYVMSALRTHLRDTGWFAERSMPNFADYLDLVALGTVADVVKLDRNNRVLVDQGLRRIRAHRGCPGIAALLEVAGKQVNQVRSSDLGFIVGPRLNAAGRLDDMSLGIRCLLANNTSEALALARELDTLNRDRRAIEASMQQAALVELDRMPLDEADLPKGVCFYHDTWHQGVIGILASRLKDRLHRPVIVFAPDGDGQLKGSGRSISQVHLRDVLDDVATASPGLLSKFGGHAMAAGLSLEADQLEQFKLAFATAIEHRLAGEEIIACIETDGELDADDFELSLAERLAAAGPWGQGFPEPTFDGVFKVAQQRIVGKKHLKLMLVKPGTDTGLIDAIAFNIDPDMWPNMHCQQVRAVYKLSINEFQGRRSLQLMIDYLEPVSASTSHSSSQALASSSA